MCMYSIYSFLKIMHIHYMTPWASEPNNYNPLTFKLKILRFDRRLTILAHRNHVLSLSAGYLLIEKEDFEKLRQFLQFLPKHKWLLGCMVASWISRCMFLSSYKCYIPNLVKIFQLVSIQRRSRKCSNVNMRCMTHYTIHKKISIDHPSESLLQVVTWTFLWRKQFIFSSGRGIAFKTFGISNTTWLVYVV